MKAMMMNQQLEHLHPVVMIVTKMKREAQHRIVVMKVRKREKLMMM
jgi:hypothetical protein